MRTKFTLLLTCLLMLSGMVAAQPTEDDIPLLAALNANDLYLYDAATDDVMRVIESDSFGILNMKWSPDGQQLAMMLFTDDGVGIMLTDRNGSDPVMLVDGINIVPFNFSRDSSRLLYLIEDTSVEPPNSPEVPMVLVSQALTPDAPQEVIAEGLTYGVGCGGGSSYPMYGVYNREAGYSGNQQQLFITDRGILYTSNCLGQTYTLVDTNTGTSSVLLGGFGRAVLSPDGTQLAGVAIGSDPTQGTGILIVNLATGELTELVSNTPVDQIAWGPDNAIYYSTRELTDENLPLTGEQQARLEEITLNPFAVPVYEVTFNRYNLATDEITTLLTPEAWSISSVFTTADHVYFNLIPNGENWVRYLLETSDNVAGPDSNNAHQIQRTVAPRLYRIPFNDLSTEPEIVGAFMTQIRLNPAG